MAFGENQKSQNVTRRNSQYLLTVRAEKLVNHLINNVDQTVTRNLYCKQNMRK